MKIVDIFFTPCELSKARDAYIVDNDDLFPMRWTQFVERIKSSSQELKEYLSINTIHRFFQRTRAENEVLKKIKEIGINESSSPLACQINQRQKSYISSGIKN